jgi:hypothetical protein
MSSEKLRVTGVISGSIGPLSIVQENKKKNSAIKKNVYFIMVTVLMLYNS